MVYMNTAVPDAEIRYTLDGTEPDEESLLYTGPFTTDADLVNACAFYLGEKSNITHSGKADSSVQGGDEPLGQSTF